MTVGLLGAYCPDSAVNVQISLITNRPRREGPDAGLTRHWPGLAHAEAYQRILMLRIEIKLFLKLIIGP